jgi:HKD family nuclease
VDPVLNHIDGKRHYTITVRQRCQMNIDVVDNEAQSSMIAALRKELATATMARLATASLTRNGIKFIEEALNGNRKTLRVRLLIGLYNGQTEPAALRRLLRLVNSFGEHLEVKIAENPRFHWKAYIFTGRKGVTAFIGSSNLTADGLDAEGEINLRIAAISGSSVSRHIIETFDRVWGKRAVPLNAKIVERFVPVSRQSHDVMRQIDPVIKQILRPPKRTFRKDTPIPEPRIMTYFDEFPSRTTTRIVMDKTAWQRKGWSWIVFPRRSERDRMRNAGAFYLAELHKRGGLLSVNELRDDDDFRTEDGRFFIAYQRRKGSILRNLSPSVLSLLKEKGVVKRVSDLRRERRVSKAHREVLDGLLRAPRK